MEGCQVLRLTTPNLMSTTTEREGKHEQETDSNAGGRGNGWSDVREAGTGIPRWFPSWISRRSSDAWSWIPSPPSPWAPLWLGRCRSRARNGCVGSRHSSSRARCSGSRAGLFRAGLCPCACRGVPRAGLFRTGGLSHVVGGLDDRAR